MATFVDDPDNLAPARAEKLEFTDGSFVLRSPQALGPYVRCIGDWLERWAKETPDALAFAERDARGDLEGHAFRGMQQQLDGREKQNQKSNRQLVLKYLPCLLALSLVHW